MLLYIVYTLFNLGHSYRCLPEYSKYSIPIKVYTDEESAAMIVNYQKQIDAAKGKNLSVIRKIGMNSKGEETLVNVGTSNKTNNDNTKYVKEYFNNLFDRLNKLFGSGYGEGEIRFVPNFDDLLRGQFTSLKYKYCSLFNTIESIADSFNSELGHPTNDGHHGLFITNCIGNKSISNRTVASKKDGECSFFVAAIVNESLAKTEEAIINEILSLIAGFKIGNSGDEAEQVKQEICTYIDKCSTRPLFGFLESPNENLNMLLRDKANITVEEINKEDLAYRLKLNAES